jgi:ABC-2 type transport system ATP-binding protein
MLSMIDCDFINSLRGSFLNSNLSIELADATIKFAKFTCGPIRLKLKAGEQCAIFGANGAGKTTMFQAMSASVDCTEGEVLLNQTRLTPNQTDRRRLIGVLPQNLELPQWSTAGDIISYAQTIAQVDQKSKEHTQKLLEDLDLEQDLDKISGGFSFGMRKRLGLILAMMTQPQILILDEPFSGLDIHHVKTLRKLLEQRIDQMSITIISTHVPTLISDICDRAAIIKGGQLEEITHWSDWTVPQRISHVASQF